MLRTMTIVMTDSGVTELRPAVRPKIVRPERHQSVTTEVACTDDTCDEDNDECDHTPDNTQCDDGDDCTDDTCDATEGCVYEDNGQCNPWCGLTIGYWANNVKKYDADSTKGRQVCDAFFEGEFG